MLFDNKLKKGFTAGLFGDRTALLVVTLSGSTTGGASFLLPAPELSCLVGLELIVLIAGLCVRRDDTTAAGGAAGGAAVAMPDLLLE